MDINAILNDTIAGLLVALITIVSSFIFKFLKRKYYENKIMLLYNISFYFDIFAIVYVAINFRLDKCSLSPFSFGDIQNLIFFIILVCNVIFTFIQYNNIKKYINRNNQK